MAVLRTLRIRNLFCLLLTIVMLYLVLVSIEIYRSPFDDQDKVKRMGLIDQAIKTSASNDACRQPFLPVHSREMMQFDEEVNPIDCSAAEFNWVKCEDTKCEVTKDALLRYGRLLCSFTDILRLDDFTVEYGKTVKTESYNLKNSDVVKVICESGHGYKWTGILTGIRNQPSIWDAAGWQPQQNGLKVNVLMFGIDSLSRNAFIRKLPKTYKYMTEVLGTLVLQGYNIVGDGTPQALIPILTGYTEIELPDTRKRIKDTAFVDIYPFIWKKYKQAGYVTGFLEDVPDYGSFTYRLAGFYDEPTDHYMRPYYLALKNEWNKDAPFCSGSIPRHKVMLNHIKDFFSVYEGQPKFLFGMHAELSHDSYNLIAAADDDLLLFLKNLNNSGLLQDTLLIIMSDHGHRFANIRNTIQGKLEERLPFFSFTFPEWFKESHKNLYDNFVGNLHTLTTPFDIHETLVSILNPDDIPDVGDLRERALSLFSKIPPQRSCRDAYIEPHWCACLEWYDVEKTDPIVQKLARTFVNMINNYTSNYRHICAELFLAEVYWVTRMRPNKSLLKFNKAADLDGFVGDFSSNVNVKSDIYQLQVMLNPGSSLFEYSITHIFEDNQLVIQLSDISRINMYDKQAKCITSDYPFLRKYCYCKQII